MYYMNMLKKGGFMHLRCKLENGKQSPSIFIHHLVPTVPLEVTVTLWLSVTFHFCLGRIGMRTYIYMYKSWFEALKLRYTYTTAS